MYVNRMGMAIQADLVVVQMTDTELEEAIEKVLLHQIGDKFYVRIAHAVNGDGIFLDLSENSDSKISDLRHAGYKLNPFEDINLALNLLFDMKVESYHYDGAEINYIFLPVKEYIEKTFNL